MVIPFVLGEQGKTDFDNYIIGTVAKSQEDNSKMTRVVATTLFCELTSVRWLISADIS